jgi:hypothetical protein
MDEPLTSAPLEAWFCANCSRPAIGDRCPSCGWVLPEDDDVDDDDPDRTWPLEPPTIIDPPGGEGGH